MASERALVAARELYQKLGYQPWITTIGVGERDGVECLYVYASRVSARERSAIPREWEGIPVLLKKLAAIKAGVFS